MYVFEQKSLTDTRKKLRYHVNINTMTVFYSPSVNFIVQNDVNV